MMSRFDFLYSLIEEGYSKKECEEAFEEYERELAEYQSELIDELEERQMYTAYQQDLIDMRRFER